jgi:hypothetical protein
MDTDHPTPSQSSSQVHPRTWIKPLGRGTAPRRNTFQPDPSSSTGQIRHENGGKIDSSAADLFSSYCRHPHRKRAPLSRPDVVDALRKRMEPQDGATHPSDNFILLEKNVAVMKKYPVYAVQPHNMSYFKAFRVGLRLQYPIIIIFVGTIDAYWPQNSRERFSVLE